MNVPQKSNPGLLTYRYSVLTVTPNIPSNVIHQLGVLNILVYICKKHIEGGVNKTSNFVGKRI